MNAEAGGRSRDRQDLTGALVNYVISTRHLAQLVARELGCEHFKGDGDRIATLVGALERCQDIAWRAGYVDRDGGVASRLAEARALACSLITTQDHVVALDVADRVLELEAMTQMLPQCDAAHISPDCAQVVVSRSAHKILSSAARLLPTLSRQDKAMEFAAELYDLAAAGASRRRQLIHALRVMVCIIPLRRALSSSRRRALDRGY